MLSFDSCNMGQVAVLDSMEGAVDHIVASSEVEKACGTAGDGQNIEEVIQRLFQNPQTTANQLAESFVDVAREGLNGDQSTITGDGKVINCDGTETLAHYDMSAFEPFRQSFNELGAALTEATTDQNNRAVLETLIAETQVVPAVNTQGRLAEQNRDLAQFSEAVEAAIASGQITDENGRLSAALTNFTKAHEALVQSYNGDTDDHYDQMGGLTAFLTDTTNSDAVQVLQTESIAAEIDRYLNPDPSQAPTTLEQQVSQAYRALGQKIKQLAELLPPGQSGALDEVQTAIDALNGADQSNFGERLEAINIATDAFFATPTGQAVREAVLERIRERIVRMHANEIGSENTGWAEFLTSLTA